MDEFLAKLTELSRSHNLIVTEWMDTLAIITPEYTFVQYIGWDDKEKRYTPTGYMGAPLDDS